MISSPFQNYISFFSLMMFANLLFGLGESWPFRLLKVDFGHCYKLESIGDGVKCEGKHHLRSVHAKWLIKIRKWDDMTVQL